jgi:hypothetical protein
VIDEPFCRASAIDPIVTEDGGKARLCSAAGNRTGLLVVE